MGAFSYFPHTEEDIRTMLERIGVSSLDDLYADVPAEYIYKGEYDLPSAMSEQQVRDFFEGLADKNTRLKVFVGQGAYDHYVPSVIPYITSRSEFLTAYTPYQCEISQGTLRYTTTLPQAQRITVFSYLGWMFSFMILTSFIGCSLTSKRYARKV